jgi:hypothetical protein
VIVKGKRKVWTSLYNFIEKRYLQLVYIQVEESEKSHNRKSPENSYVKIHIDDAAKPQSS